MINKIASNGINYWEYETVNFKLFAFSLPDLLRDLKNIYSIEFELFNFNLN